MRDLWLCISDIVGVHIHQWSHACLLQVSPRPFRTCFMLASLSSCSLHCHRAASLPSPSCLRRCLRVASLPSPLCSLRYLRARFVVFVLLRFCLRARSVVFVLAPLSLCSLHCLAFVLTSWCGAVCQLWHAYTKWTKNVHMHAIEKRH